MSLSRRLCWLLFGDRTQSLCSRAHERNWRLFIAIMDLFEPGHCARVYRHYHKD